MAINTVTLRKGVPGAATCQVVRVRRSGMTVIVEEGTHGGFGPAKYYDHETMSDVVWEFAVQLDACKARGFSAFQQWG
jgi:hypothetical protein